MPEIVPITNIQDIAFHVSEVPYIPKSQEICIG